MNIRETAHAGSGAVLTSLNEDDASRLTPTYLLDQLAEHGYLVLRGFQRGIGHFSQLVRSTSSTISLDPARRFDGDTAQKVDAGYDAVGLHCENGNSPFWPDLCWFYCETAPRQGSQTTVCDGKLVYEHMSAAQREAFGAQDIMYTRRVDAVRWKTYVFHALASRGRTLARVEDASLDDLLALIEQPGSAQVVPNDDGSIHYRFHTPAIRASRINPRESRNFANSLFGPSNHYEKPVITFADGCAIPVPLLEQTEALCERFTTEIGWQTGDIVLIDNTRVMHGRRAIEDRSRSIFNALSYARS
jgi:alpha-ketoglutarate-dependent taurine dioxygenase